MPQVRITWFGGQVMTGLVPLPKALTVTAQNEQCSRQSQTVMVTVCGPAVSGVPDGILCEMSGGQDNEQLVTMVMSAERFGINGGQPVTLIEEGFGQITDHGCVAANTMMLNWHEATTAPPPSKAVQVTTFVPSGKTDPLGGEQVNVTLEQLPDKTGAG